MQFDNRLHNSKCCEWFVVRMKPVIVSERNIPYFLSLLKIIIFHSTELHWQMVLINFSLHKVQEIAHYLEWPTVIAVCFFFIIFSNINCQNNSCEQEFWLRRWYISSYGWWLITDTCFCCSEKHDRKVLIAPGLAPRRMKLRANRAFVKLGFGIIRKKKKLSWLLHMMMENCNWIVEGDNNL